MARTSLRLDDELLEEIENNLSYGDSKAEWIRQAIRFRQHVDPILDEVYDNHQREKRLEFVEAAVKEKVDRVKQEADKSHENNING
jgi:metal-responsive CopG/Arc/MetJ family transcriptional regulator